MFCYRCSDHEVAGGHARAGGPLNDWCKQPSNRKTIKERRKECHINRLPQEILVLVFEYLHSLCEVTMMDNMRDIIHFGLAARFLRTAEVKFWAKYVKQTLNIRLQSERSPTESFYLHLSHMPHKLRNNPKEIVLYSYFCCDRCGQKNVTLDCHGCLSHVCQTNECGSYIKCECSELVFHCNSCHERYYCERCQRDMCKECVRKCILCNEEYCRGCFYLEPHTCWISSESESEVSEVEEKELIKCIQCNDVIECEIKDDEKEMFGQCPQCEYYNEINGYKLCKSCIITCQFCDEEMCQNCMTMYHEPCEQWMMCKMCHSEWSRKDGPCDNCGSYVHCTGCVSECCEQVREIGEQHVKTDALPELPDDIILLLFKLICPLGGAKATKEIRKIFLLGSVNKQFKRVENQFWRQVVDRNPFFTSKLKNSTKLKSRDLHLSHYFGCNDCNTFTTLQCGGCDTHMCLECYKYSRIGQCECTSEEGLPIICCRSCTKKCPLCNVESCLKCDKNTVYCSICQDDQVCVHSSTNLNCCCLKSSGRICNNCKPLATTLVCGKCSNQLCLRCTKNCENCDERLCPGCSRNFQRLKLYESCTPRGTMVYLPTEILLHIFEIIMCEPNVDLVTRVTSVINVSLVNKQLNKIETYFWKFIVAKEIENEVHFIPHNRRNFMPPNLATVPKELFLWQHLSCAGCGYFDKESKPIELKSNSYITCANCGYTRGPFLCDDGVQHCCRRCYNNMLVCCDKMVLETTDEISFGFESSSLPEAKKMIKCIQCDIEIVLEEGIKDEDDVFGHCSQCEYYNDICGLKLCKNCIVPCQYCLLGYCVNCTIMHHVPCKQRIIAYKCVQCDDEIICYRDKKNHEEKFGHCPQCEYFNKINVFKLCKSCIITCQFCDEEMCQNCMTMYHEPCEQWMMCKMCHSEWSRKDGPCDNCGSYDICFECRMDCDLCGEAVCSYCYEHHLKSDTVPELPDDIILLLFKLICPLGGMTTIKEIRKIFLLGSVSKQFKRVENQFWRQVVDRNPFSTSKLKNSTKLKSRDLHLSHYFGCNDCNTLTTLQCGGCDTHMCLECYKYSRIGQCECMSEERSSRLVYCRSCIGPCNFCNTESCPNCITYVDCAICEVGICNHQAHELQCKCRKKRRLVCIACHDFNDMQCQSCSKQFCTYCRQFCQACYKVFCNECCQHWPGRNIYVCSTCAPFPGLLLQLPDEILLRILEMIICDSPLSNELPRRISSVICIGRVNKQLSLQEAYFWKSLVTKEMQGEISIVPQNPNFVPPHLAMEPKQRFFWQHLGCVVCGQFNSKFMPVELRSGARIICKCGVSQGPYFTDNGVQYICHSCCAARFPCYCCFPAPSVIGRARFYECFRCHSILMEQSELAECPTCIEKEIPGFKLCDKCVVECRWCKQKFCQICMAKEHAPFCKPIQTCQNCHSRTKNINYCTVCLRSGCDECQFKCNICLATACNECMQRHDEIDGEIRICRLCNDEVERMELD